MNIGAISYPEGVAEDGIVNYYGKTVLKAELLNFEPEDGSALRIKASWQLCNEDGMCLFPQSAEADVSAGYEIIPADGRNGGFTSSILFFLLLSFLGGLLLNVMPCVLPVLSIKALSLVKQGGENRRQILVSSLLYTAGVVLSLLALAVVIIIIKASGEQVGWGFQFQNRGFVIVLLTIIFVFALSLFEVFTIAAPIMENRERARKTTQQRGFAFFQRSYSRAPCNALHRSLSRNSGRLCFFSVGSGYPRSLFHGGARTGFSVHSHRVFSGGCIPGFLSPAPG